MKTKVLLLAFILSGCAAIGPVSSPEFPLLVAKAVPKEDGEIHLYGSGNWFPNTRGFTDLDFVQAPDYKMGVLVITDRAVVFEQWDNKDKAFYVVKRLPYSELADVSLDTMGVSKRIVLRKTDLSYESFDFTQGNGSFIDNAKIEQAIEILRERIKP